MRWGVRWGVVWCGEGWDVVITRLSGTNQIWTPIIDFC